MKMFSINNSDIKERICSYRKALKVTQQDLAIFLDMKRASYRTKESEGSFDWDETVLIADFLNTSPFFIKYGVEDDDLRVIGKILKQQGGLHQPNISIFDDIEKYKEDTQLYISFLNLPKADQARIIKHIEENLT